MEVQIIDAGVVKFMVTRLPKNNELEIYKTLLINYKVNLLIRIVDESQLYDMKDTCIKIEDFTDYKDGEIPNDKIIKRYKDIMSNIKSEYEYPIIAIHCVSSLGRTCCFIGIELMNVMNDNTDIVIYIRRNRNNAFNTKQLEWFVKYKPISKIKWWRNFLNTCV